MKNNTIIHLNTNSEMLFSDFEDTSFLTDNDVSRVYNAGFTVFTEQIDSVWAFYRVGCSSNFKEWNGGKFSHQSKMYGYTVGRFFAIENDFASETLVNICHLAQSAMESEIEKIRKEYESNIDELSYIG